MLYRTFGKMEWSVSAVGLGTWNIGNQWGEMEYATAESIVHTAIDKGVNLIDVADSYGIPHGLSEIRLGRALKGKRNGVYIVSKVGQYGTRTGQKVPFTTADMVRLCGHAILGRLRTEWVDVLLCHEATIQDPRVFIEGFEELKGEGFIRQYGISTNDLETLKRFYEASLGKCAVVELDYSLVNIEPEKELLPYCRKNGIAVLARGPLARGILSGRFSAETRFTDAVRQNWNVGESERAEFEQKLQRALRIREAIGDRSLAQVALRYVISHPTAPVAIPGATRPEHAEANALAGAEALGDDLYGKLKAIA
jgi:myo-inositol catabolism protein IolS